MSDINECMRYILELNRCGSNIAYFNNEEDIINQIYQNLKSYKKQNEYIQKLKEESEKQVQENINNPNYCDIDGWSGKNSYFRGQRDILNKILEVDE